MMDISRSFFILTGGMYMAVHHEKLKFIYLFLDFGEKYKHPLCYGTILLQTFEYALGHCDIFRKRK